MSKKNVLNLVMGWLAAITVFAACVLLNSCNVGLGETVDTQAPVVTAKYPPVSSTIRSTFVFYGTFSDDKGVGEVTVTVKDTNNKKDKGRTYSAELNPLAKTWQVLIDSTEYKDGNYQFSAQAKDLAGHKSGESSCVYDIDNSAPFFIISNPGVVKGNGLAPSKYGSTLSIEGTIADDHTISLMDLTVYECKEDGSVGEIISGENEESFFEEKEIATAGGSSVVFANSNNAEGDSLRGRYFQLYRLEKGTQRFYCSVKVADSAKVYMNPLEEENTSTGNATSEVYLYDDIYESLMSTKNGGLGLNANSLKNILNGTVSNELLSKEKLLTYAHDTDTSTEENDNSQNYLYFSLNPAANPTYVVSGYDVDFDDEETKFKQCMDGSSVAVSISAGLDGTGIIPFGRDKTAGKKALPSLKVWMKSYAAKPTSAAALADLETLSGEVSNLEKDDSAEFGEGTTRTTAGWLLIYDYKLHNEASSSTASDMFAVSVPNGISNGVFYVLGVTGCDIDGVAFDQSSTFAFEGNTAGYAANTVITTPKVDQTYSSESEFEFEGYAKLEDENLYVEQLAATFTYAASGDSGSYTEILTIQKDDSGKYTISHDLNEDESEKDALYFVAEDIHKKNLAGEDTEEILAERGTFKFDVTRIKDFEALKAKIDSTGKQYTYTLKIDSQSSTKQSSTATRNVYIDTVKPAFDDENSGVGSVTSAAEVLKAWFNSDALKISGVFKDSGSGVATIEYWLDKGVDNESDGSIIPAVSEADSTKYTYSATIGGFTESTVAEPCHTLKLRAVDQAGNVSAVSEYEIRTDMSYPEVKSLYYTMGAINGSASGSILTNKTENVVLYGTISDGASGVAEIKISGATVTYSTKPTSVVSEGEETSLVSSYAAFTEWLSDAAFAAYDAENATSITSYKAVIPASSIKDGDVSYTVSDSATNKSTMRMFSFNVDTTKPEIEYKDLNDADVDSDGIQVNGKIVLSGTANDNNQMKQITSIEYRLAGEEDWKELSGGVDGEKSSAYSWNSVEIDTSEMFALSKTNDVKVSFRAVGLDAAGNYSEDNGIELIVNQETDRPVIKISSLDDGENGVISSTTLVGTISDDDGVKEFSYKDDNDDVPSWKPINVSSGSWKIENLKKGSHSISFEVVDKADTKFVTGAESGTFAALNRPKVSCTGGSPETAVDGPVSFKIDLNPPVVSAAEMIATNTMFDTLADALESTEWKTTGINLGKSTPYFYVKVALTEDVAMNGEGTSDITMTIGRKVLKLTEGNFVRTGSVADGFVYAAGPFDVRVSESEDDGKLGLEGSQSMAIVATDRSGRVSETTILSFYVDGEPPVVNITYPLATQKITTGETVRGTVSDASSVDKFMYMIPAKTQLASPDKDSGTWTTPASKNSIKIDFTSSSFVETNSLIYYATQSSGGKLTYALKKSGDDYVQASVSDLKTTDTFGNVTFNSVYVPILFYAEDETGNGSYTTSYFCVNPYESLPAAEILSPSEDKIGESLVLSGLASDTQEVKSVKVTEIAYVGTDVAPAASSSDWTPLTKADFEKAGVMVKGTVETDGSILAEGTTSWKVRMDLSKLTQNIKHIKITVYAFDENADDAGQLERQISAVKIVAVDKEVPEFTAGYPKLVKFAGAAGFTDGEFNKFAVAREYEAGMYIANGAGGTNGGWYLIGEVTDDSSVEAVSVATNKGDIALSIPATPIVWKSADKKTYRFAIPVDTSDEGQCYTKLALEDGQNAIPATVNFYVDNTAPAMFGTDDAKLTSANAEELRLKSVGMNLGAENVVENSDGSFSFGDTAEESGSGLAYIAFYVKKTSGDGKVYSPMSMNTETALAAEKTSGSVYINSENLPALYISGVSMAATGKWTDASGNEKAGTTVTDSSIKNNKNVRAGGLVKIDGAYYKIGAVDSAAGKITLQTVVSTAAAEIEVIYAQVVDHMTTESFAGVPSTDSSDLTNDDLDGMVETLKQTGASYKWTASILSDNIPDGPAQIHVVAFDEAGNSSYGYVSTSIQNNRPRIAKVYLGTDLNGNNKFDYFSEDATGALNGIKDDSTGNGTEFGELSFYSALDAEGKIQGTVTLKSQAFVASKDLLVLPEIVGGNGALKYNYMVADSAADAKVTKKTDTVEKGNAALATLSSTVAGLKLADRAGTAQTAASLLGSTGTYDKWNYLANGGGDYDAERGTQSGTLKGFVLGTEALTAHESWTSEGKDVKYFAFTIWDSTDDTTQGVDSLYAFLKVPLVVNVIDDVAPTATITPFYWNSKEDGSFVYDENGNPLGHIDIDDGTGTVHPGVAGRVYIEGRAKDETRLGKISVKVPTTAGEVVIAEYKNGTWDSTSAEIKAGLTAAKIEKVWVDTITEPSQKGHEVHWKIDIDMSSCGIRKNQTVDVIAADCAETANVSAEATAQTINDADEDGKSLLTSHYIMDFVPYIQSIYPANAGSANRSRLGRFPVQAGKDMVIKGMNFGTSGSATVYFWKSDADMTDVDNAASSVDSTVASDGTVTVAAPEYSRYVSVVISGAETQNNVNTDLGCNIEAGYVAKDGDMGKAAANEAGTNFWTDDRYISVWNVETTFTGSINPHSGVIKKVTSANSDGGKLYTIETGDAGVDSISGADDTYFGAISSDDLRVLTYDIDSKTGDDISKRYTFGQTETDIFGVPADALDCTIVNGVPYYVVQDNWLGNVDANCWGPGLYMARAGWQWNKGDLNSNGTTASTENYHVIIEKQGSDKSAKNRNSSQGYDSILYQFKNPRIAGWNKNAAELAYNNNGDQFSDTTDYIYISYYDSYARCLKYAAYRAGHRINPNGKLDYKAGQWGSGVGRNNNSGDLKIEMRMADDMDGGKAVVAGFDTLNDNPTQFAEEAGEWSDIMVDVTTADDPRPVIVYYNNTKRSIEVAYGQSAFPKKAEGNVVARGDAYNSATDNTETVWTKTKGITPDSSIDFGRYVSAAMDKDGNLHIAAQDATNVKLYYMFLVKNSDGTYTVDESKTTVVDGSRGSGSWTDIELTDASGNSPETCKPVISYINSSYLGTTQGSKVAYAVEFDETTGKPTFEAMTDPAKWKTLDQRTSVLPSVKEDKSSTSKRATVAVGFNSNMLALDFLRGE